MSTLRDISRKQITSANPDKENTDENIKLGSLQRIADALEIMTSDTVQLKKDLAESRQMYQNLRENYLAVQNINKALRGHITRLKKKNSA